jgi:GntR family transcriptional regulator, rspAB operon transcriptional repressor
MALQQVSRVARRPTAREVYRVLREGIEDAQLEPGQRLSENELAGWLGVSRTPVREAIMALRDDRLVESVPQLGTFVTRITRASLEDAQFVRVALECAAVVRATRNATDEDIAALRAIVARQDQTREAADLARFYVLDDEFHSSLCVLGGHAVAWSISQRASGHLNRVRRLSLPVPAYIAEMVAEHGAVVDAIAAGDPERARAALAHHLSMVLTGLPAVVDAHPEFFETDADRDWAHGLTADR